MDWYANRHVGDKFFRDNIGGADSDVDSGVGIDDDV